MSTKQSLASAGLDINYFSYYPNNFLITAIGRWFWNFLNLIGYHKYSDFVIGMGLLNYILVDLSILLLYRSLNSIFNKKNYKTNKNKTQTNILIKKYFKNFLIFFFFCFYFFIFL